MMCIIIYCIRRVAFLDQDDVAHEEKLARIKTKTEAKLARIKAEKEERLAKLQAEEETKECAKEERIANLQAEKDVKERVRQEKLAQTKAEKETKLAQVKAERRYPLGMIATGLAVKPATRRDRICIRDIELDLIVVLRGKAPP